MWQKESAVTFDSYVKEDGSRKSEYGKYVIQNGKEIGHKHVIRYNDGIIQTIVMLPIATLLARRKSADLTEKI